MGKPYAKEGPSAEDKALDLFADMMILMLSIYLCQFLSYLLMF